MNGSGWIDEWMNGCMNGLMDNNNDGCSKYFCKYTGVQELKIGTNRFIIPK